MDFDNSFAFSPNISHKMRDKIEKWDKRFLQIADVIGSWSKDPSSQIGAVVVDPKNRRILSTGYNGFPSKIKDDNRLNIREQKYKLIVHAEQNAIYNATMNGVSLADSTLYVTGLPTCSDCAKGIIQVGITRVVCGIPKDLDEKWKKSFDLSIAMYKEAGVDTKVYLGWY